MGEGRGDINILRYTIVQGKLPQPLFMEYSIQKPLLHKKMIPEQHYLQLLRYVNITYISKCSSSIIVCFMIPHASWPYEASLANDLGQGNLNHNLVPVKSQC